MELIKKLKRKPIVAQRKALAGFPVRRRGRDGPVVYPRRDAMSKKPRKPLLKKLWGRIQGFVLAPVRLRARVNDTGPKNGWLALGLLASLVMTVILGTLSMRLIRDPSVATKAFGPALLVQTDASAADQAACPALTAAPKTAADGPPQVTFYSKLRQEERPPDPEPISGKIEEKDLAIPAREGAPSQGVAKIAEKVEARTRREALDPARSSPRASEDGSREPALSGKVFSVQVGAFSHPAVAKQWAEKWRARGYDVILKPVARPRSGVIYRLYLGSFPTAKQAEELVGRLKAKEGVTAFAVALK